MAKRPQRPDGRPRGIHDKAYAKLTLEGWNGSGGIDPDDPATRPMLLKKFDKAFPPGLPGRSDMIDKMVDDMIADAKWAKDGFPTK